MKRNPINFRTHFKNWIYILCDHSKHLEHNTGRVSEQNINLRYTHFRTTWKVTQPDSESFSSGIQRSSRSFSAIAYRKCSVFKQVKTRITSLLTSNWFISTKEMKSKLDTLLMNETLIKTRGSPWFSCRVVTKFDSSKRNLFLKGYSRTKTTMSTNSLIHTRKIWEELIERPDSLYSKKRLAKKMSEKTDQ